MKGSIQPTKYTDVQSELYERPALTEEEKEVVDKKQKALDELLSTKHLAKYKLEVMFGDDRSMHRPFSGSISFWESGSKLHGGGDSKLYVCDSVVPGREARGCGAFIPDSANGLNFIVCPKCNTMWRNEEIVGEIWFRLTMHKWAEVLLKWFQRLEHNADIRLKYARKDIRSVAEREQDHQMGGELLEKARDPESRATAIYPLANIIKDTAAGADLYGRILAFLSA